MDFAKKFFLAGLGAVGLVREKAEQLVNEMIEKGEIGQGEARELVEELVKKGEKQKVEIQKFINQEVEHLVREIPLVRKKDLEMVTEELEAVKAKLADLEERLAKERE
ncbi:MAG: hypothetical protein AB1420_01790 [Bacillota bacterium]